VADSSLNLRKRLSECTGVPPVDERDPWITGVAIDSRRVKRGDLFVAYRGEKTDGHRFARDAAAAGAAAVVVDQPIDPLDVPVVRVADAQREASFIAARFFDHPSRSLRCVGVTGTNGKTSVTVHVAELLSKQGERCAFGGTLGWGFEGQICGGRLTTEDPVTLQRRLAELVRRGARGIAMEVSSHALAQHRADGVELEVGVFTNLTRDHLDYHGSMDRYAAAKRRLFDFPSLTAAVVNVDDPVGAALALELRPRLRVVTYGSTSGADISWQGLTFDDNGVSGELVTPWVRRPFALPLYGEFAVANVAAALGVVAVLDGDVDVALQSARTLGAAPGRMQRVRRPGRPLVVIDYAHTPDALTKALGAARRHVGGRVICVFGCGGDRDKGKRPLMAQAVEAAADIAWVTNDNPRSEVPAQIANDVTGGFSGRIPVHVELDRQRAIELAIASATSGDLVLVAGKGHETYQEIGGQRLPHNDLAVVEAVLR
jgi:UDP-N-acetylmuramoyl-L-alanyl-D-glutamate--2,6-diaminopimelate ligase